ncbi:MAG: 30S ribosomal protein S6 [Desulfobulbaceae bacterium]|nr:30S ribosomal protein S6 [Desulfobulbaceae bacterium]
MRRYETTYILRPNLGETQTTEIIDRTNDIINNDGGTIIWFEQWGVKKLAYEINKENHGYYVYFDFAAPGTTVQEMERIFNIDDRVLRFLTIKVVDSIAPEEIEQAAEKAASSAAAKSAKLEESDDDDDKDEDEDEEDSDDDSSDDEE